MLSNGRQQFLTVTKKLKKKTLRQQCGRKKTWNTQDKKERKKKYFKKQDMWIKPSDRELIDDG